MKKGEIAKVYEHIHSTLLFQTSIINVGYEAQNLLNAISMLHQLGIVSQRDSTNLIGYIIGLAEDQIKILNYERLQKDER